MPRYMITLGPRDDYDAIKQQVESQGGSVVVNDAMRDLGLMTVDISDSGIATLKQFDSNILVEQDSEVTINEAA